MVTGSSGSAIQEFRARSIQLVPKNYRIEPEMWNSRDDVADKPPHPEARPPERALARLVGARIKLARRDRGLTLLQLAQLCGTTAQTVQRLEAANMTMSLDWLERICDALKLDPATLFADRETPQWLFKQRAERIRGEAEAVRVRAEGLLAAIDDFTEAANAVE